MKRVPYSKLKEERQNLVDLIPLVKPFTLVIEPSSLCNFRCIQCFQSIQEPTEFHEKRMNMSMECFNRIIDEMKNWSGPKLKVLKMSLYGEPLINPLFGEMLQIAHEANIAERIETTTNASLLTADISEKLISGGLDYLRVSIYSPIQEKHTSITGSKFSIKTIHDNLLKLKNTKKACATANPFVSVKMLETYGDENNLFREMYQDAADEIYFDKPHNWIPYKGKNFVRDLYGHDTGKAVRDIEGSRSKRIACTLPFFTLAVRSNGDVSPCCNDWIGGTNLSNIFFEPLESIWNGDAMYRLRKMHLENRKHENTSCAKCNIYSCDYYIKDNVDSFPIELLRISR